MKTIKIPFLIFVITFLNLSQSFANQYSNNDFKSIHAIQLEEFKDTKPEKLKNEDYYKLFTKGELSTPRVKKQVLGYYTYWKTGTDNIQWDLLTILAYFSAELDSSGNITDLNGWPSSAPIYEAHSHGVKVILTATLFGSDSIRTLIQNSSNRENCIENLFNQVQSAEADGICIDFELPYSTDREYFNTFIQELADYFHSNMPGSLVVIDTPAVNWSDRMDFDTLTDYADYLFIMAYDYHYAGGDPGPVSPLSYTDGSPWPTWAGIVQTLDDYINGTYGVGETKKGKLLLGVPYYGYDWPAEECEIPTTQRADASAVIYSTAVDKAEEYYREWDNYSQTPFYDYNCYTSYPHQAWYDDDISIGLKYDKVNQYNIGGTGMWALNYDGTRTELWEKIREKFGFFYITSTAYGNGTINPSGQIQVDYQSDKTFVFTPADGYHISEVKVDGESVGTPNSYTFSNVTSDHTIEVYFEQDIVKTYTVTATAGNGGTISPSGAITVNEGESLTFTITPNSGYQISKVTVDGTEVGTPSSYTFENINQNHTIEAEFSELPDKKYTIKATCTEGGSIYPYGEITVNEGEDISFHISPNKGYLIDKVEVDGVDIGKINEYTFTNVSSNHQITAFFTKGLTPELKQFTVSPQSGLTPLKATFSCQFEDPENRAIKKYYWIIKGDIEQTLESEEPEITFTFNKAGTYFIKVEAENDIGSKGESDFLTVKPIDFKNYPATEIGTYNLNEREININAYALNPFGNTARITLTLTDKDGNKETKSININPFTKVNLSEIAGKDIDENLYELNISPNSFLLIYGELTGENLNCAAYQPLELLSDLYIPHIAEETNYWDTLVSIGNKNQENLIIKVGEKEKSIESKSSNLINLNSMAEDTDVEKCWGQITDINQSQVLNGFEAFIQKNGDGAAITLSDKANNIFYIPHIPEEKDIFWTGFTIINTQNQDGQITFYLYDDNSNLVGTKKIAIKAGEKLKGLFENFFPEQELQNAVWGYAYSNVKVSAIELYGVNGGALCGYPLPAQTKYAGILPLAESNENTWTGLIALNPNYESAEITFKLYDGNGNYVTEKTITINPQMRFKSLLKDLFDITDTNEKYFIEFSSTKPIVCIEVEGDGTRTFMKSLNAY